MKKTVLFIICGISGIMQCLFCAAQQPEGEIDANLVDSTAIATKTANVSRIDPLTLNSNKNAQNENDAPRQEPSKLQMENYKETLPPIDQKGNAQKGYAMATDWINEQNEDDKKWRAFQINQWIKYQEGIGNKKNMIYYAAGVNYAADQAEIDFPWDSGILNSNDCIPNETLYPDQKLAGQAYESPTKPTPPPINRRKNSSGGFEDGNQWVTATDDDKPDIAREIISWHIGAQTIKFNNAQNMIYYKHGVNYALYLNNYDSQWQL